MYKWWFSFCLQISTFHLLPAIHRVYVLVQCTYYHKTYLFDLVCLSVCNFVCHSLQKTAICFMLHGEVHLSEKDIQYLTLSIPYREYQKFFPNSPLLLFTSLWSKKFILVKCACLWGLKSCGKMQNPTPDRRHPLEDWLNVGHLWNKEAFIYVSLCVQLKIQNIKFCTHYQAIAMMISTSKQIKAVQNYERKRQMQLLFDQKVFCTCVV